MKSRTFSWWTKAALRLSPRKTPRSPSWRWPFARVAPHAHGPHFVAGKARGVLLAPHQLSSRGVQDFFRFRLHVFPQRNVILTEPEADDGDRNPVRVHAGAVDCHPVLGPGHHLAESSHLKKSRLPVPHLLFEAATEPFEVLRVARKHEARVLDLVVVAALVSPPLPIQIEARNVRVVGGPVVVDRRGAGQLLEVSGEVHRDVPVEVTPHAVARARQAVPELPAARSQQQTRGLDAGAADRED